MYPKRIQYTIFYRIYAKLYKGCTVFAIFAPAPAKNDTPLCKVAKPAVCCV